MIERITMYFRFLGALVESFGFVLALMICAIFAVVMDFFSWLRLLTFPPKKL